MYKSRCVLANNWKKEWKDKLLRIDWESSAPSTKPLLWTKFLLPIIPYALLVVVDHFPLTDHLNNLVPSERLQGSTGLCLFVYPSLGNSLYMYVHVRWGGLRPGLMDNRAETKPLKLDIRTHFSVSRCWETHATTRWRMECSCTELF